MEDHLHASHQTQSHQLRGPSSSVSTGGSGVGQVASQPTRHFHSVHPSTHVVLISCPMFRHSQPEEQNRFPQDQIQQTYQPNICPSSNQLWYHPPTQAHLPFQPHQLQQDNSSVWIPSHLHHGPQHVQPTPPHQTPSYPILQSSPNIPATTNPTSPRHVGLPRRVFQAVFSKPNRDAEACWRCRNSHTKVRVSKLSERSMMGQG